MGYGTMGFRMSVPGTAADVSTSYYDSISTVPGTGPRGRNAPEGGTPVWRAHSPRLGGRGLSTFNFVRSTFNV